MTQDTQSWPELILACFGSLACVLPDAGKLLPYYQGVCTLAVFVYGAVEDCRVILNISRLVALYEHDGDSALDFGQHALSVDERTRIPLRESALDWYQLCPVAASVCSCPRVAWPSSTTDNIPQSHNDRNCHCSQLSTPQYGICHAYRWNRRPFRLPRHLYTRQFDSIIVGTTYRLCGST